MSAPEREHQPTGSFEAEQAVLWQNAWLPFADANSVAEGVWTDDGLVAVVGGHHNLSPGHKQRVEITHSHTPEGQTTLNIRYRLFGTEMRLQLTNGLLMDVDDEATEQARYFLCLHVNHVLNNSSFDVKNSRICARRVANQYRREGRQGLEPSVETLCDEDPRMVSLAGFYRYLLASGSRDPLETC